MDMTPHFPIYLDYGATTPVDPRVVDAMIPWLREHLDTVVFEHNVLRLALVHVFELVGKP